MTTQEPSFFSNESFKCLFDNYRNRLYGYVLAITHSHYTAEEITQEIFMKLWLCRDVLNQVDNLDGYIFAIARNKTLNHLRKAAYDVRLLKELQALSAGSSNDVEERSMVKEYDRMLHEALSLLSPQRRLVYVMSRQRGLDHAEIAHQLQLSRNTVKNHMVEALRFIRHYFVEHGSVLLVLPVIIDFLFLH
jgi:RNA polymerase sigma-70 factor (ECF subfamily)